MITHIPLDDLKVARIGEIIPPEFHARTWIAGSAAARWPQNADVDAWVVGYPAPDIPALRRTPRNQMYHLHPQVSAETTPTEMYADGSQMFWSADGIHLLWTHHETIDALINAFDISCHAAAINIVSGDVVLARNYDPSVQILTWHDAAKTLMRGMRFAERYNDYRFWYDANTVKCLRDAFPDVRFATEREHLLLNQLKVTEGL